MKPQPCSSPSDKIKKRKHPWIGNCEISLLKILSCIHFDLGISFVETFLVAILFIFIGTNVLSTSFDKDRYNKNTPIIFKSALGLNETYNLTNRYTIQSKSLSDFKELIDIIVPVLTAGALFMTAKGLHDRNHQEKLSRASEYAANWFSEPMKNGNQEIRQYVNEKLKGIININSENKGYVGDSHDLVSILVDWEIYNPVLLEKIPIDSYESFELNGENYALKEHLVQALTFFENMGHDIKFNVADEKYLKGLFYSVVIKYYEVFKEYLRHVVKNHSLLAYCNFISLANNWIKSPLRPEIPKSCRLLEKGKISSEKLLVVKKCSNQLEQGKDTAEK